MSSNSKQYYEAMNTNICIPGVKNLTPINFYTRPGKMIAKKKSMNAFLSFLRELKFTLSFYAKQANQSANQVFATEDESCIILIPDYQQRMLYRIDLREFVTGYMAEKGRLVKTKFAIYPELVVRALQSYKTRLESCYYEFFEEQDQAKYDMPTDAALNDAVHHISFTIWNINSSYIKDDIVAYYVQDSKLYQRGLFYQANKNIAAHTPFSLDNFKPLTFK